MTFRRIMALLTMALASVVLAACGGGDNGGKASATASGTPASGKDPVSVTFVGAGITDPYYLTMHCGAEAAAKEFNIKLDWQGVNTVDYAPEVTAFNAVVQRRPDAIVLVPFSATAFVQPVQRAMASGVKVITADVALAKTEEIKDIRTDNIELGGLAAEQMKTALNGQGTVAVVSFAPDVPIQADRVNGFKRKLAEIAPDIKVVTVEYGGADAGKSAQKVAALLQRYPDLSGIFGTDTADAEGAGSAIKAAGKRGKVKLIAYDASPKLVSGLRAGLYDALVAQAPFNVGYESFKAAAQAARGDLQKGQGEFWMKTGGKVVTRENVDSPDAAKFLYKEACS